MKKGPWKIFEERYGDRKVSPEATATALLAQAVDEATKSFSEAMLMVAKHLENKEKK